MPELAMAQPGIGFPALGYVYDSAHGAIRAIRGIPGAALAGDGLDAGFPLRAAFVSPKQDYVIATAAENSAVRIIRWNSGSISSTPLADSLAPEAIFFSPSGSAAVLAGGGRLQLTTGLPHDAAVRNLQPPCETAPSAVAVADDGVAAFACGAVQLLGRDGNWIRLPFPDGVAALAFSRMGRDLTAATHAGELYLATSVDTGANLRRIGALGLHNVTKAHPSAAVAGIAGLAFSADGASVFAVTRYGMIASIDFATGAARHISCGCAPSALVPFGRSDLFRLTDFSSGPLWLFDGAEGRLWFVPAMSLPGTTEGAAQ